MRVTRWSCLCLYLGLTLAASAQAQAQTQDPGQPQDPDQAARQAREADLFGEPDAPDASDEPDEAGESSEPDAATAQTSTQATTKKDARQAREDDLFGEAPDTRDDRDDAQASIARRLEEADQRLALGGFLFLRADYAIGEGSGLEEQRLRAPQLMDLFLDARPDPRVRAYARARLIYDFTSSSEQAQSALVERPSGADLTLLGQGRGREQVLLDQLWLKFDLAESLYVTVGRQRVRWGAGRFWNPTDFLNATQIDPLAIFDQRLGVDLIKLHYPIASRGWNLYAVGILSDATTLKALGGALRGEFVLGKSELSLSMAVRRQTAQGPQALPPVYSPSQTWPQTTTPVRLGADFTGALGPVDLRLEAALTRGLGQPFYRGQLRLDDLSDLRFPQDLSRAKEWIAQAVVGLEYGWRYNDQDSVFVAAEYFYNSAGYEDSSLYLWQLVQGGFRPLYMGRHYAALGVVLPAPGSLDDMTFSASGLGNLSDRSFIARIDYTWVVHNALSLNLYAMKHLGEYGEFRLRVEVPPLPVSPQLAQGLVVPAPDWDLGVGLRTSF